MMILFFFFFFRYYYYYYSFFLGGDELQLNWWTEIKEIKEPQAYMEKAQMHS